jgi:two-component system NtrC family sensor kinase
LVLESALLVGALAALAVLVLGSAAMVYSTSIIRRSLTERAARSSLEIRDVLATPLYTLSDTTAINVVEAYLSGGQLDGIRLESYATGVLVMQEASPAGTLGPYFHEISSDGLELGNVTLWFSDHEVRDIQNALLRSIGITTLGTLIVIVTSTALVLRRRLSRALRGVVDGIGQISSGNYRHQIPATPYGDVNPMVTLINNMSDAILAKNAALEDLNASLERQVEQRTERLRVTSEKLRTAERMMALGTLVAGISHELNTPLGNALTALSFLEERSAELPAPLAESAGLARRSLDRAITLVTNFRQIATDRAGEGHNSFSLTEAVEEALETIRPRLERKGIDVHVGGENVRVTTHRDAIWPIITNLAFNASTHAYSGSGRVEFLLSKRGDMARIEYQDFGVGMDEEVRSRAFEPFFTTARGSGGMGLGMYVLYNLATGRLGGTIDLESLKGKGTKVVIEFPVTFTGPKDSDPADTASSQT